MTRFVSTSAALFIVSALFVLLALVGCGGPQSNGNTATSSPPKMLTADCANQAPDLILKTIYDEITKNTDYAKQEFQFNITVGSGTPKDVTIIGWSTDRQLILDVINRTAPSSAGCRVVPDGFVASKGDLNSNYQMKMSCPPHFGPCGDICIPEGELCKITGLASAASGYTCVPTTSSTPTGSPTPSPVPTPTKTP